MTAFEVLLLVLAAACLSVPFVSLFRSKKAPELAKPFSSRSRKEPMVAFSIEEAVEGSIAQLRDWMGDPCQSCKMALEAHVYEASIAEDGSVAFVKVYARDGDTCGWAKVERGRHLGVGSSGPRGQA